MAYFGDLTLGGTPSLRHYLHASGELNPLSFGAFNNGIRIGFFNANDTTGYIRFAGFQVSENMVTPGMFRLIPTVHFGNGSRAEADPTLVVAPNTALTWTTDYDPTLSRMSMEIFNTGGTSLGMCSVDLTLAQASLGASFNAFGLLSGGVGEANPNNIATVYIDNLTYSFTPVPEPTSMSLCAIAGLVTAWSRARSRQVSRHS